MITRLEVIENGERKYTKWDCKIEQSIQDEGRTLKIFVEELIDKNHNDRNWERIISRMKSLSILELEE